MLDATDNRLEGAAAAAVTSMLSPAVVLLVEGAEDILLGSYEEYGGCM